MFSLNSQSLFNCNLWLKEKRNKKKKKKNTLNFSCLSNWMLSNHVCSVKKLGNIEVKINILNIFIFRSRKIYLFEIIYFFFYFDSFFFFFFSLILLINFFYNLILRLLLLNYITQSKFKWIKIFEEKKYKI